MHTDTDRAFADAPPSGSIRARAVVVAGPPASGKTTLGAALAGRLRYAFLDLDVVTGPLTRAALALAGAEESALGGALGEQLRAARYGALLDTAAANLALGLGAVICAPFTRERSDAVRFRELTARLGGRETALVCLELPEPVRIDRMRVRGAARDRPAAADVDSVASSPPIASAIRLDGAAEIQKMLNAALIALGGHDLIPLTQSTRC